MGEIAVGVPQLGLMLVLVIMAYTLPHVAKRRRLSYVHDYKTLAFSFLMFSGITLTLYWQHFKRIELNFSFLLCPLMVVFIGLSYYVTKLRMRISKPSFVYDFSKLDSRYLVSKSFNILFQQVMIYLLYHILNQYYHLNSVIIFVLLFTVGHLLTLFYLPKSTVVGFVFSSFFGGLAFAIIYYVMPAIAFPVNFVIHWGFYLAIGISTYSSEFYKENPS